MKRALLLMIFIPMALAAQERDPSAIAKPTKAATLLVANASSTDNPSSLGEMGAGNTGESGPGTDLQRQPSSQATQTANPAPEPEPINFGKMVGYVDSAVVSSEVRIRFDDAFHDSAPDRAEFFYAQCNCTNEPSAKGPNFPGASANVNFQQIYLEAEYAPISRFSFFAEVPYRWIEPQPNGFITGSSNPNASTPEVPLTQTNYGISDVRAGIKVALASSSSHALTVQLRAYFPSGDSTKGLGTAHYSIEPSLLYYQRLSDRWAIESQIGDSHPIGGSTGSLLGSTTTTNFAGDVFFYGVGPSYRLIDGERFKLVPVVELFGWHVIDGLETAPPPPSFPTGTNFICSINAISGATGGCSQAAGGTNVVNLKIGARTFIGHRNSIYVGFGQAVTHAVWYEHIIRLEYRYSF